MNTTIIVGAKGGVGTSTVAALLALSVADHTPVALSATTDVATADLAAILGCNAPVPGGLAHVAPTTTNWITLGQRSTNDTPEPGRGHNIVDSGTDVGDEPEDARVIMVLRNDYLSLRRALAFNPHYIDGLILVTEAGRPLGQDDVAAVLDVPILATIPRDITTARIIDAGILASSAGRLPRLDPSIALGPLPARTP